MYMRYAEIKSRDIKIMEHQVNGIWWLKFALIKIKWEKIYSKMKFESWVHRVQRIPETESIWRVHTSTVTIAVLPEVTDVKIEIRSEDIETDTFAASSAGWQHANKNQTWIRLHHKPTGIIVTWTDSRSQLQNKENAMKMLKLKIYQIELDKQQKEQKDNRVNQIWTGDRSEKIRTYNFPQDRVTDHRVKNSWSNLPWIMNWEIDNIIESMFIENQAMLLWANK
jgi:peptide chain release factor 1